MNKKAKKRRVQRIGRAVTSPERAMIIRVMEFFEEEKRNGAFTLPVSSVLNRTSKATGVSPSTVKRIRRALEASKPKNSSTIDINHATPAEKRKTYANMTKYTDEVLKGLKQIVDSYIEANGKMMPLDDTLAAAKKNLQFPGNRGTLKRVLEEKLGYEFENDYKKHKKKKKASSSSSESEDDYSDDESTADEKECAVNGTETDNNDCHDPIMLCEVAMKEEVTIKEEVAVKEEDLT